jgi:hypothetical protein
MGIGQTLIERKLQAQLAQAELKAKELEAAVESLTGQLDVVLAVRKLKYPRVSLKHWKSQGKGQVTACMVGSDWHLEERVTPGTVAGLNEYDLGIARSRVERYFKKGLFLLSGLNKLVNIEHLVMAFLGDFISGHLYDECLENNQLSPTEALWLAQDSIKSGLTLMLAEAPCKIIDIVCASGNHGRTTVKRRISTRVKHSFENILYRMLRQEFAHEPRIRFIIEEGYHVWHKMAGKDIRFHHGDSLRYQGGVGGLYIPVGKAIAQWNRARPAYLDIFGHWHQCLDGGNFICNGSLIGYNPFAVEIKATFERPQQQFFLLDQNWGKILTAPIFVGEEK